MTSGFLLNCSPYFFKNGLSLNLELTNWLDWMAKLADTRDPPPSTVSPGLG